VPFSELIKNFNKTRDYMRDFYIYGFKARGDFSAKSPRTYDDEKRRIESWLDRYVRWENDSRGKRVYISLDASEMDANPLYAAWKSRSFTDNDITLHFVMLSVLQSGEKNVAELTDAVCEISGRTFEAQTVRNKANEYMAEGLLRKEKRGKTDYYRLSGLTLESLPADKNRLLEAICFFQETAPFGFTGSTILDQNDAINEIFRFKHHYIVHTLEDGVLYELLRAVQEKRRVLFTQQSSRLAIEAQQVCIPLQIFISVQSGRRYVCAYIERTKRFHNFRLDFIKKAKLLDAVEAFDELQKRLDRAKRFCWGVSFGGSARKQTLHVKLHIDEEKEKYVLERLRREGRGGEIKRVEKDTFLYIKELYDTTEMMAWVKSFTGRILSLEGTNREAIRNFYSDMERMAAMYGGEC